jgi:hypothetical protein
MSERSTLKDGVINFLQPDEKYDLTKDGWCRILRSSSTERGSGLPVYWLETSGMALIGVRKAPPNGSLIISKADNVEEPDEEFRL